MNLIHGSACRPEHKELCYKASEMGLASVCKFVQRSLDKIIAPAHLKYYFQSAILHKIRSKNLEFAGEATFRATLFVGLEPVDIRDFERILRSPAVSEDSEWCPMGMLQILDLDVSFERDEAILNRADLAKAREILYRSLLGETKLPLVLMDVVYRKPDAQLEFHNYSYSKVAPLFFSNTSDADRPQSLTIPAISSTRERRREAKVNGLLPRVSS